MVNNGYDIDDIDDAITYSPGSSDSAILPDLNTGIAYTTHP